MSTHPTQPPGSRPPQVTAADGRSTPGEIAAAAAALHRGELVAFPTETVYGLGADASDPRAVAAVFAAKGRPADHPLIVHLASADMLDAWAREVPDAARRVAEHFWPGPLTLILRRRPEVPDAVTGGQDTIGLRVPGHPVAHALLEAFGGGIAAPSANRFGRVSPTTRAHVLAELGDRVATVLDGGTCEVGLESTILDLSSGTPRLLRPGGIAASELAAVLGTEPTRAGTGAPRTPGRLPSHYAPATPVRVVEPAAVQETVRTTTAAGQRVAVLRRAADPGAPRPTGSTERADGLDNLDGLDGIDGLDGTATALPVEVLLPDDAVGFGRDLYARLAGVDRLGCDVALVVRPPVLPGWEAVHDRLGRAEGVDPHTPRVLRVRDEPSGTASLADGARRDAAPPGSVDLGTWTGPAGSAATLRTLPSLPGVEREIWLSEVRAAEDGSTLLVVEASDANGGIAVGRHELTAALDRRLGPGTARP